MQAMQVSNTKGPLIGRKRGEERLPGKEEEREKGRRNIATLRMREISQ